MFLCSCITYPKIFFKANACDLFRIFQLSLPTHIFPAALEMGMVINFTESKLNKRIQGEKKCMPKLTSKTYHLGTY
jgi:hypothetical protein